MSPRTSSVRRAAPPVRPMATTRPAAIPTSASCAGAPLPSLTGSVVAVLVVPLAVPVLVLVTPAVAGPGRRAVLLPVLRAHVVVAHRHGEDRARHALDRDEAPRPVEARGVEPVVLVERVV